MALKYIDSFDHYQTAQLAAKWSTFFLGANIMPGLGRCGSQALQMGGSGIGGVEKGVAFAGNTAIMGFAYNVNTQIFSEALICWFACSSGSTHQVYLARALDGSLIVYRDDAGGALLGASAPDIIRMGSYYFIEFKATIHASAGVVEVRVNGATVILLTGVNTISNQSGGIPLSGIGFFTGASYIGLVDDLYIVDDGGGAPWNTFLGDCRVEYLRPDGAGATQAWDLIGAASHWQAVDDNASPDDDASYIHTATVGLTDTETYKPTGLPTGSIYGLQANLYARKTDSGPRSIAPVLRHAGVDYVGGNQQPSFGNYQYLNQIYMLNPGTGVAWTIADVNALEAGVKVTV